MKGSLLAVVAAALWFAPPVAGRAGVLPPPAGAVEAAEPSVVRVISLSFDAQGQLIDAKAGSGFFVAPGEVITNDHVVEAAQPAAAVRIFVIPERDAGERGVIAAQAHTWREADLALLTVAGIAAPALKVTTAIPGKDATVHAIGYPAVTDAMRNLPIDQILAPGEPYVTPGAIALISHTAPGGGQFDTIFHTAPINPGNSGGPLIDACGRVIGVNAWEGADEADAEEGAATYQGQFAAVDANVLARFLAQQNVAFEIDATACAPPLAPQIEARLAAAETAIATEARLREQGESALREQFERDREIAIVVAMLLVAAGTGVAVLVILRRSPLTAPSASLYDGAGQQPAWPPRLAAGGRPSAGLLGVTLACAVLAAGGMWLATERQRAAAPATSITPTSSEGEQRLSCVLAPEQSFNVPPDSHATAFTLDAARACINGRTPYEKTPTGLSRVMTAGGAGVVSLLSLSADLSRLQRRDYPLSGDDYAAVGSLVSLACDSPDAGARLAGLRARAAPYLTGRPIRQLTWRCTAQAIGG